MGQKRILPKLVTERLVLREVVPEDASFMFEYFSMPETTTYTFYAPHEHLYETENYVEQILKWYEEGQLGRWGITLRGGDRVIGTIGFGMWLPEHKRGEVEAIISPIYWNKGIATEALRAVLRFGFIDADMNRIEAHCFPGNSGSIKVLERCGFSLEGVLRDYYIYGERRVTLELYSLLRNEWR